MASLKCELLLAIIAFTSDVNCANILAVFPHTGKSHQDVFQPLVETLAQRGHQVTVLSHYPRKQPLENYTDIQLKSPESLGLMFNSLPIHIFRGMTTFHDFFTITNIGLATCEPVFSSPGTQQLLNSDSQFDLVITELFNIDCFLGFVYRFKAPFIALSSSAVLPSSNDRFGNPDNPAYVPNVFLTYSDRMTYWERMHNAFTVVVMKALKSFYFELESEKIARKYFGKDMPPLSEIAKNTSLLLVNTHPSLNRPRAQVPAVIDVGGMHIKEPNKLPSEIQEYLDNSAHGVVVFSMGSVLLTHTFPEEKKKIFFETFSEIPQNIICKWENDSLPGQPPNVKTLKWLPQRDILAHPNVVAFVSHGGLLGTTEAVFNGVPIVGMPMYGDQGTNVKAVEASGAGIYLTYSTLTKESFKGALTQVINDKRYKETAEKLSAAYRDRPLPPLETAVFWTEYILKHGGRYLRTASADMPLYQYLLLDVLLGVVIICGSGLYIFLKIVSKVISALSSQKIDKKKNQ